MNKKTNTLIFMLIATIVNIVLLCLFFGIGLIIINVIASFFPESGLVPALMILVFLAAIVLGFFAYSKLVKWAIDRFNLEEKMDPIFSSGRKGRGKTE